MYKQSLLKYPKWGQSTVNQLTLYKLQQQTYEFAMVGFHSWMASSLYVFMQYTCMDIHMFRYVHTQHVCTSLSLSTEGVTEMNGVPKCNPSCKGGDCGGRPIRLD